MRRPEHGNRITQAMAEELTAALESARRSPDVGACVLTGEGDVFCLGGDYRSAGPTNVGRHEFARAFIDMAQAMARLGKPLIAAVNGNAHAGGNLTPPTSDSQAHLVVASDKAKSGDYETAIKNYRLALSGANSQTGYVYQQMGTCFQRIKDKASAISSFNRAIEEYHKLESANQQVDLARAGIKVCENGIKLCNIE